MLIALLQLLCVQLESVERLSQAEWKTEVVLPSVSFAPLILPSQESVKDLKALEIGNLSVSFFLFFVFFCPAYLKVYIIIIIILMSSLIPMPF